MQIFRGALVLAWIVLMAVSVQAVAQFGLGGANIFFADFEHPWRAQFNTDFTMHIVLIAAWIFWREESPWLGAALALLAFFGGVYTLLYILAATIRAKGDMRVLLLGKHA